MDALVVNLAGHLDHLRASFLRSTTSSLRLRSLFLSRSSRIAFLFALSFLMSLGTSVFFPLWVLIAGPVIYGIPHLFASLRYVPETLGEANKKSQHHLRNAAGFGFLAIALYRVLAGTALSPTIAAKIQHFESVTVLNTVPIELPAVLLLVLLLCAGAISQHRVLLRGLLLTAGFTYLSFTLPLWTAGALILAHNFVAFVYWIRATREPASQRVAVVATLIFIAAHAAIFAGAFDGLYALHTPTAEVSWAELDYATIGRGIAPWSENYRLWFHSVVAYAFGQSMHYFVWLKAIPDQVNPSAVPTSFRQSLAKLKQEFGLPLYRITLGIVVAALMAWGLMHYTQARVLYFCAAAFHGYFEIAGLFFLRKTSAA